ncbi:MAG: hypothetical protein V4674_00465 [Patescibacteria group bacterium]
MEHKEKPEPKESESAKGGAKKEATSLAIIKTVGLIVFLAALVNGGIWIGLGVGILDFIFIVLLESIYYESSAFVRSHLREQLFKILFVLLGIATLVILVVLFSRSLFEGFIALIAVIILLLMLNRE